MIKSIQQGLDDLQSLSASQLDTLIASAHSAFEVAEHHGDADEMSAYLSAARKFTDRKKTLLASGSEDTSEPAGDGDMAAEAEGSDTGDGESAATASADSEDTGQTAEPSDGSTDEAAGADASDEGATGDQGVEASAAEEETGSESTGETGDPAGDSTAEVASAADGDESTTESAAQPTTGDTPSAPPSGADSATTDTTSEETTVTASASVGEETLEVPEDNQPITASAPPATVIAGADVQGVTAGSTFQNAYQVGQAFLNRIRAVKRASGGDGERHTVATVASTYPEERTLDGDAESNGQKIQAVLNEAMVASGGYCAPLPVRYDIFGLGVTDRPVRSALPMFNASRGGVRFVAPPVLTDLETAVGLWTAANDREPGSGDDATKAEMTVTCAEELTAEADAVTLQLKFGNFMTRAYPELVNRNTDLGMIQHARFAELELLSKIEALSTAVTAASRLGIGRDWLASLSRAACAYRTRHRMPRTTPLRVIAPGWVLDAIRTDLSQGLPGDDNIAYADSQITQFLNRQRVRVNWHMDDVFDAQGAGSPLVDYPSTFKWHIFAEGTFIYLDGGTLDLGVVRDSGLVSTNDYKTFSETFEGVARIGVESLTVTQQSLIDGAVVGSVAPLSEAGS